MRRKRRGWLLFWLTIPGLVLLAGTGLFLYHRPVPAKSAQVVAQATDETKPINLPWPSFGQSAVGSIQDGVLATTADQKPAPTASTAKIMTALAILRQKPLAPGQPGPTITMTAQDQAIYDDYFRKDGSLARIQVGEQISQYQALQALLLPSANNFADTLVNWAFGSMANYTTYANTFAKELGMQNSNFADASGFSAQTTSTARDLVLLAQAALKEPVIADIVSQKAATIPVAGQIFNTNGLLGRDGITGVKTGNTTEAGGVFVASSRQTLAGGGSRDLISVVMGGPDLTQAMRASVPLVTAAGQNFVMKKAVTQNETFGVYTMPWDDSSVNAVAKTDTTLLTWSGTTVKTKVDLKPITGSRANGTEVGTATVTAGDRVVKVPIILEKATTTPTIWYRLTHK